MRHIVGFASGLAFAAIGTAVGLYCAWLGFPPLHTMGSNLVRFAG